MCNNIPAELTSPENGLRLSGLPMLGCHLKSYIRRWYVGRRGSQYTQNLSRSVPVRVRGTSASADLGGRSKYSKGYFEGRRGDGFHVNSNWTWVRRS